MIQTLHLFRPLQQKLIELLTSLDRNDWSKITVAGDWDVKAVTAHLLDGNLRDISLYRDRWELPAPPIGNYTDLINYLNRINADWVTAMRRVSPEVLIAWLQHSHEAFIQCLEALDPQAPAKYSVAWAGEKISTNWFHIAREYTEKWHHQQQIREAVGKQAILTREFYYPALDTFLQALPFQYSSTSAPDGTRISLHIDTEAGGTWQLERQTSGWNLVSKPTPAPHAEVFIPASLAWKLLTKAVRFEDVRDEIQFNGDQTILIPALRMISVIA